MYEGSFVDGARSGLGKLFDNGTLIHEGEWKEGKQHGRGTEYFKSEIYYQGDFWNGYYHGKGKYHPPVNDKFGGGREITFNRDEFYEGEWKEGVGAHGIGSCFDKNGNVVYEGEWRYGL